MSRYDILRDVPRRVIDQEAMTVREMKKELGMGHTVCRELAYKRLRAGAWQRVWKMVDGRPIPAYRRAK